MVKHLSLLMIVIFIASCNKKDDIVYEEIGEYFFKYTVTFDSKGGEKSLLIKDTPKYKGFFEVSFDGWQTADNIEMTNPILPVSRDTVEGEWYHAVIPNSSNSSIVVVSTKRNSSGMERKATIVGWTTFSNDIKKRFAIQLLQR